MAKYHINPKTGNPGVCKAKIQCRFGDLETEHYSTEEEARSAFESRNDQNMLDAVKKNPNWKEFDPSKGPEQLEFDYGDKEVEGQLELPLEWEDDNQLTEEEMDDMVAYYEARPIITAVKNSIEGIDVYTVKANDDEAFTTANHNQVVLAEQASSAGVFNIVNNESGWDSFQNYMTNYTKEELMSIDVSENGSRLIDAAIKTKENEELKEEARAYLPKDIDPPF